MSIIRRSERKQFLVMEQNTVNDLTISWEAKGLLTYLLGRPDNWKVTPAHLIKHGSAGRDKLYRMIKELVKAGYIQKIRMVNEKTKQVESWEYVVFENSHMDQNITTKKPLPENTYVGYQNTDVSYPQVEKEEVKKPLPCFPDLANKTLTSTDTKLIPKKTIPSGMASPSECSEIDESKEDDLLPSRTKNKQPLDYSVIVLANIYFKTGERLRFIKCFGSLAENWIIYECIERCLIALSEKNGNEPINVNRAIPYCKKAIADLTGNKIACMGDKQ